MNIDTCSFFDMGSTTAMFGNLLTFAIKAKGPILLPCGTPAFTYLKLDSSPSNFTLWVRSERCDANQGSKAGRTPINYITYFIYIIVFCVFKRFHIQ
jgi:hypothetical protein